MSAKSVVLDYFDKCRAEGERESEAYNKLLDALLEQKKKNTIGSDHPLYNEVKELALLSPDEKLDLLRYIEREVKNKSSAFFISNKRLRELIIDILKVLVKEDSINILNSFSGTGALAEDLFNEFSNSKVISQELNSSEFEIQRKLFELCDLDIKVDNTDSLMTKEFNEYDVVTSIPPLGSKKIKLEDIYLENIDKESISRFGHDGATLLKSLDLVKEGGIVIAVLSLGFLFSGRDKRVRDAILEEADLLAIVETPKGTFLPYSGVQGAIVVLRKKFNDGGFEPNNLLMGSFSEVDIDSEGFEEEKEKVLVEWKEFVNEEV